MLALDDLNDAAFGAAVGAAANDARQYAVAVHGVVHVVASDEEIAFDTRDGLVRNDEAVAVAMRNQAAGDEIGIASSPRLWWRQRRSPGGSRLWRVAARVRGPGGCFRSREAVAATLNFLDVAGLFELLNDARQKAATAMLELQAMSDLADAGRLRLLRQVSDDLFPADFRRSRLLILYGVLTSHVMACRPFRLTDFTARGKNSICSLACAFSTEQKSEARGENTARRIWENSKAGPHRRPQKMQIGTG